MNKHNGLGDLDLNLLVAFHALLQESSVTRAGRKLGVSQPAISYALAKLRKTFGDPLFVRVGDQMRPTARAQALSPAVVRVLDLINTEMLNRQAFDPITARRRLSLSMSDVGESNFVAPILQQLVAEMPNVDLAVHPVQPGELQEALATGAIDLALGYFPDLKGASIFQQTLFKAGFVCVARAGNPFMKEKLTLRRFISAPHVALQSGARTQGFIERDLRAAGIDRQVKLTVQHFMTLIEVLPRTDLIAVVPVGAAQSSARAIALDVQALPYSSSRFPVKQYWHKRYHHDAANQWFRGEIRRLFQHPTTRSSAPAAREMHR